MKVLLAGASGYLGRHLIKELQKRKMDFKVLVRNTLKIKDLNLKEDQIIVTELTKKECLKGVCAGFDVVISTVGITRQKDGLTFMQVDYQANKNLLEEAEKAFVNKFVYFSIINGASNRHLKLLAAKELFVDKLKKSTVPFTVIRPNGFYSDMSDFLEMAKKGKVYLFGDGNFKLNPIHGEDLAVYCVDNLKNKQEEILIGGPDILTQNELAELAFAAYRKNPKIVHLPDWIRKLSIRALRLFSKEQFYGPIEFFLSLMAQDNIAPRTGIHRLSNHFRKEVNAIKN